MKAKTYKVVGVSCSNQGILESHPFVWDAESDQFLRLRPPNLPWQLSEWDVSEIGLAREGGVTPDLSIKEGEVVICVGESYKASLEVLGWWEDLRKRYNLTSKQEDIWVAVCKPGDVAVTCRGFIEAAGKGYDEEFAKGAAYPSERALAAWDVRKDTCRWTYREHMLESLVHSLWVGNVNRARNEVVTAMLLTGWTRESVVSEALARLKNIPDRDFAALLSSTGAPTHD